jgi:transposase-like protein
MPSSNRAATELAPLLDGSSAGELIPELVRHGLQQLIELEVAAVLGAERHERSEDRLGYRNGYRPRVLTTQAGDIDLLIPKLRTGGFLPSILEPRRRVDQALYGVVMEAYIGGISTRKVDTLVAALGVQSGISKSQVSRICQEIDQQVQAFLNRPLQESGYAYVYLDATYLHGRLGRALQVCSRAAVIAMGVNADGRRELLGLQVGDSETESFWSEFIGSLKERGLSGVKLVISDAHVGLTNAIRRMLQGCCWQRCRVHFARNLLQRVPKAHQGMVTAALRSVFSQEDAVGLVERWDDLAASLAERFPRAAEL